MIEPAASSPRESAALAIEKYGREISSFLLALHHDYDEAADVYGAFCEDVMNSIETVRDPSSLRGWLYTLARRSSIRHRRQQKLGQVRISELASVLPLRQTTKAIFQRTSTRNVVERLKERLSNDEKALLILRVDRQLEWREIAQSPSMQPVSTTTRREALLRKRFERIKTKLSGWLSEELTHD